VATTEEFGVNSPVLVVFHGPVGDVDRSRFASGVQLVLLYAKCRLATVAEAPSEERVTDAPDET
jgi:hypothetical protein